MNLAVELASPSLVDEELLAEATTVAFPGLSGVLPGFGRQEHNDWGLGFEIRDSKAPHWTGSRNSPRTFGHFGQSGSFLWVDPDAGLACVGLADRDFGDWATQAWPKLADDLLAAARGIVSPYGKAQNRFGGGMAAGPRRAAEGGEGRHPEPGRDRGAAPSAADGQVPGRLRIRQPVRPQDPARPVRRPASAGRLPVHGQRPGRLLPRLHPLHPERHRPGRAGRGAGSAG